MTVPSYSEAYLEGGPAGVLSKGKDFFYCCYNLLKHISYIDSCWTVGTWRTVHHGIDNLERRREQ